MKELKIVPLDKIPKGLDCSFDNLPELYKLGRHMQVVCEKENGIGLAAVQVGIPLNFFILKQNDDYRFFVNCTYAPLSSEKEKYVEGCLSIKDPRGLSRYFEVERFKSIVVKGKELVSEPNLQLKDIDFMPTGDSKTVFQHEIDHAFEILISQIGKEIFLWSKKE